ncbi:MAG: hypothetical protein JO371_02425 [Paraburkholderia sp.]|nr:hypothetical protein [Paraburkholderia sp.]
MEAGFLFGQRQRRGADPSHESAVGVVQAAASALVGLLLGFSFSLAVSRFDERRADVVHEGNAISTTVLRSDFFDAPTRLRLRSLLRQYVAARLDFAASTSDQQQQARADARSTIIQVRLWNLTVSAVKRDPHSTLLPLFVQALNDTIDASGVQAAALAARIPDSVIVILVVLVLVTSVMVGMGFGRAGKRGIFPTAVLAVMFALVISTIIDLDRPQQGFIRVSLEPLRSAQQLLTGK